MTDTASTLPPPVAAPRWQRVAWLLLPLVLLLAAVAWIVAADPLRSLNNGAPPVEALTYERTILDGSGIRVLVRGGGSEPMSIAQVQVDDAYWTFTQDPAGPLSRGSTAWIALPYPWVVGEAHAINIVTSTGTTFEHEIPVAVATPQPSAAGLTAQALIGAIVGILPVAVGLMFYPALRGVGRPGMNFLLALTIGLLAFLLVDMGSEALELAGESAALFQGPALVVLAALASFLVLMAIGRWRGTPQGLALSFFIALGIGLHNLGEGLAIGAAFAAGSAGLGTFLVLGFAVHNITEGIGIAAPILKERPPLWSFVALTVVAGAPAVIGMWLGSLAVAPQWSALALAVGAGAILQVIVEVGAYLLRSNKGAASTWLSPAALGGLLTGVAFMYATAALIKI
ncbi:MAG: ZIP family metal transporter [Devosia sp.]|uniref:ZIP family metal transporter n=1 Tax=Devosia sp. TaxID=1871048 RepID=UPI001ACC1A37|nr:ZIP family metal transporter [Devosia sp.]MBN9310330.1 ZIP family metal transporter [Devosia sp.]MBN9317222.1 ZIP family metal transporter [Devosia sp.]